MEKKTVDDVVVSDFVEESKIEESVDIALKKSKKSKNVIVKKS